jgi:anti-sigma factor RsiW
VYEVTIMNDYEVLMMDALDGTITPAARAQLDAYLDQHPDARAMFDAMLMVDTTLKTAPAIPAPPTLTQSIMRNTRTIKIARPIKSQDVAVISGVNALITMLVWAAGFYVVGAAYSAFAPAGVKQIVGALARFAASMLDIFARAAQTLLMQPITWAALALSAIVVLSWLGVLSRLMRPARRLGSSS